MFKIVGNAPRGVPFRRTLMIMDLPQRKLQRLRNYNYAQNGMYFVTLCTQNRLNLFGQIENGDLVLNDAGKMVFHKFEQIPQVYPDIAIDKFIVMPNHLHAILMIQHDVIQQGDSGTPRGAFPTMSLSDYIHRFKTLTTKLYIDGVRNGNYPPFDKKIWQKSYHEHIIRNEQDYQKIWDYIDTNPLKWQDDKYFT